MPANRRNRRRGVVRVRQTRKPAGLKSMRAVVPFRTRANRQLISIPEHNHQLHVKRVFRVKAVPVLLTGLAAVSLNDIASGVRSELGITTTTTAGEMFAVHSATFYFPQSQENELSLKIFDIEEATAVSNPNLVSHFTDHSSATGISNISIVHPVNNRPTWNRITANTTLYILGVQPIPVASTEEVICDILVSYIRTPDTDFLRIGVLDDLTLQTSAISI